MEGVMTDEMSELESLRLRVARLEADLAAERALAEPSAGSYFTVPEHVGFHQYAGTIDLAMATPEQRMIKLASHMIKNSKAIARRQRQGTAGEPVKHYHEQGPHGVVVHTVFGASAIMYIDDLRARLGLPKEPG
jgi:hypothetical protein